MTEAELRSAFDERREWLFSYGNWALKQIVIELERELQNPEDMHRLVQIVPKVRVKATDSFLEKALVRKKKTDPLVEITDQVGFRFVVLLLEDINRVGAIIQRLPWRWQKDRDFEQEKLRNPDYFAYQSDHYVIWNRESLRLDNHVVPEGIPCEIQIRTMLQHAYAEMSHNSVYKPNITLPLERERKIRRSLAKGSALIETTDEVFKEIRNRLSEYDENIKALMLTSAEIYERMTGEKTNPISAVGLTAVRAYHSLLEGVAVNELQSWANQRSTVGTDIRRRREDSVFFRDSIVVLLAFLVSRYEISVATAWPFEGALLQDLFICVGISPEGLS